MKRLSSIPLAGIFLSFFLTGCHKPAVYEHQADTDVYAIIDQKWSDEFGPRTNFTISDSTASFEEQQQVPVKPDLQALKLTDVVILATAHNRQYQTEKENLYLQALALTSVRHRYEPNPFARALINYTRDGSDEMVAAEGGLGFSQLLATGATVSAEVAASWVNVLTGGLDGGLAGIFSSSVSQPLLRGAGSKIALENLNQAERDSLYQLRAFSQFRKTFVVSVATEYYRLLQAQDHLQNARQNYQTLTWVYERMSNLADSGRLPHFELDQGYQDKLQAHDIFLQAQKDYQQGLDEFKIVLALPATDDILPDPNQLDAIKTIGTARQEFSPQQAIETALSLRLDLATQSDKIDDARRKVEIATDNLRAEINLIAGTRLSSRQQADLLTMKNLDDKYLLGLELDLPLDRLEERNLYRQAQIHHGQTQRDYQQAVDMVKLQVRQAYRDLTEAAERYQVQLESLDLACRRFDNTLDLLQYGRANTRDVLDAQKDLFEARDQSTGALVDYTVATLNFYRDTGLLQVRPDGMWQQQDGCRMTVQP